MVKRGGIVLFLSIFLVLTGLAFVSSGAFYTLPVSFSFNESTSGLYNMTVNNSAANVNITQVNITLQQGLVFIGTTSGTNSLGTFTNTSTVLSWVNSTWIILNQTLKYFWFNATASTPGVYNITVTTKDNAITPIVNSTNITVTINDITAPYNITFVDPTPAANINLSQKSIPVNITSVDNAGINTFMIYLFNSTGLVNNTNQSVSGGATNSTFINFTSLSTGVYYVNVTVNDTSGNRNLTSETRMITLDSTAPVIILTSPDNLSSSAAASWDFSFNVTDLLPTNCSLILDGGVTNTNQSVDVIGGTTTFVDLLLTGDHSWSVNCTDLVGNTAQSEIRSFTKTEDSSSSGSGSSSISSGSGGSSLIDGYWYVIYYAPDSQASTGYTQDLISHSQIKIKVNDTLHSVGLISIYSTSALVNISSTPQQATFNIGDEKKFDVNGNGYYTLDVKLNSINGNRASLTVKTINEKIQTTPTPSATPSTVANPNTANNSITPAAEPAKSRMSLAKIITFVVLGVIILALIVFAALRYFLRDKRKNKYLLIKHKEK